MRWPDIDGHAQPLLLNAKAADLDSVRVIMIMTGRITQSPGSAAPRYVDATDLDLGGSGVRRARRCTARLGLCRPRAVTLLDSRGEHPGTAALRHARRAFDTQRVLPGSMPCRTAKRSSRPEIGRLPSPSRRRIPTKKGSGVPSGVLGLYPWLALISVGSYDSEGKEILVSVGGYALLCRMQGTCSPRRRALYTWVRRGRIRVSIEDQCILDGVFEHPGTREG